MKLYLEFKKNIKGTIWETLFYALVFLLVFGFLRQYFISNFYYQAIEFVTLPLSSSSILFEAFSNPKFSVLALLSALPFLISIQKLKWAMTIEDSTLKYFCFFTTLLLTWFLAFSEYNYYLNEGYILERLLLILLSFAILFHPLFTLLYLLVALPFFAQFIAPFYWPYLYHIRILFDVLVFTICISYTRLFINIQFSTITLLLFSIHLANYFFSGIGKLTMSPNLINWLTENELSLLIQNAHLRGWLINLDTNSFKNLIFFLEQFNFPIQLFILIIELGTLAFFFKRKIALTILVLLCFMHIGIGVLIGVFFWVWIVINIGLIVFIIFIKKEAALFNKKNQLVFTFSMLLAVFNQPITLAWFDSKFQWYFEIHVEDEYGNRFYVDKNQLTPYTDPFVHDIFTYLIDDKMLGINGYCTHYSEFNRLNKARIEELNTIKEESGINYFDSQKSELFDVFIKTYFSNRNEHLGQSFFFEKLSPPKQLFMYQKKGKKFSFDSQVKKVELIYYEYFFENGSYQLVNKEVIKEVKVLD